MERGDAGWDRRQYHRDPPDNGQRRRVERERRGPRSLVEMAAEVLADAIAKGEDAPLRDCLPLRIILLVWEYVQSGRGTSLHSWKILSDLCISALGDGRPGSGGVVPITACRFRRRLPEPKSPLHVYLEPLRSGRTAFLTHLSLSGACRFTTSELVPLADLSNLTVLEIIRPVHGADPTPAPVNDHLIKTWGLVERPFPSLLALRIWGCDAVTPGSLENVSAFRRLAIYDVFGDPGDWSAASSPAAAADRDWGVVYGGTKGLSLGELAWAFVRCQDGHPPGSGNRRLGARLDAFYETKYPDGSQAATIRAPIPREEGWSAARAWRAWAGKLRPAAEKSSVFVSDSVSDGGHLKREDEREEAAVPEAPFEAWALWVSSLVHQWLVERDIRFKGAHTEEMEVVLQQEEEQLILLRPIACLQLGRGVERAHEHHSLQDFHHESSPLLRQYVFIRKNFALTYGGEEKVTRSTERPQGASPRGDEAKTAVPRPARPRKRQKVDVADFLF